MELFPLLLYYLKQIHRTQYTDKDRTSMSCFCSILTKKIAT